MNFGTNMSFDSQLRLGQTCFSFAHIMLIIYHCHLSFSAHNQHHMDIAKGQGPLFKKKPKSMKETV